MKFKKYCYIGDIHGNKDFCEFIKQKDDGDTFFILMGDIFDRGKNSFEVFQTIKSLFEKGKLQMVLGNHDLFFIFTHLSNYSRDIYRNQFEIDGNGGKETIKSFRKNIQYKKVIGNININVYLTEIARFLFSNFNLYYIDELNNVSIHGGIPVTYNGKIIGDSFGYNNFLYGIDYIEQLNKLLKERNEEIISKFTAIYDTTSILRSNKLFYNENYDEGLFGKDYRLYLPTWYNNEYYEHQEIKNGVIKELNRKNLNNLIVGHSHNSLPGIENITNDDKIIRLDYCIGYIIKNNNNEIIEKGVI